MLAERIRNPELIDEEVERFQGYLDRNRAKTIALSRLVEKRIIRYKNAADEIRLSKRIKEENNST